MGIHRLAAEDARRLQAGQLVTGPEAVLKELLDNAIDAGATNVVVAVDADLAGMSVADDGCGLAAEGRAAVGEAHCTSKIRAFGDVYTADTLGFRGEAIHLIVEACAEVEITTRTEGEEVAVAILFRAGRRVRPDRPCPAPRGTKVRVRGLFHRHPVRAKELARRRARHVTLLHETLMAAALSRPRLRVMCSRPYMQKQACQSLRECAAKVLTAAVVEQCDTVEWSGGGGWRIEGVWPSAGADLSTKALTRGSGADRLFVFVNGRAVSSPPVSKAVTAAFRERCTGNAAGVDVSRRYPAAVLHITAPPGETDPNLSPDKSEIIVRDMGALLDMLGQALEASRPAAVVAPAGAVTPPPPPVPPVPPVVPPPPPPRVPHAADPPSTSDTDDSASEEEDKDDDGDGDDGEEEEDGDDDDESEDDDDDDDDDDDRGAGTGTAPSTAAGTQSTTQQTLTPGGVLSMPKPGQVPPKQAPARTKRKRPAASSAPSVAQFFSPSSPPSTVPFPPPQQPPPPPPPPAPASAPPAAKRARAAAPATETYEAAFSARTAALGDGARLDEGGLLVAPAKTGREVRALGFVRGAAAAGRSRALLVADEAGGLFLMNEFRAMEAAAFRRRAREYVVERSELDEAVDVLAPDFPALAAEQQQALARAHRESAAARDLLRRCGFVLRPGGGAGGSLLLVEVPRDESAGLADFVEAAREAAEPEPRERPWWPAGIRGLVARAARRQALAAAAREDAAPSAAASEAGTWLPDLLELLGERRLADGVECPHGRSVAERVAWDPPPKGRQQTG